MGPTALPTTTGCTDPDCRPETVFGPADEPVTVVGVPARNDQVGHRITRLDETGHSVVVCWLHQLTAWNDARDASAGIVGEATLDWDGNCPLCAQKRPVDVHDRFDSRPICAQAPMAGLECGEEPHHAGPCQPLPCDACIAGTDGPCNC